MMDIQSNRCVITYGTFDLFHIGHLNLLERLSTMGTKLLVAVSTDEFNAEKGKKTIIPFEDRIRIVQALSCVDVAIPERSWNQKRTDVDMYNVDTLAMGDDWAGQFDHLNDICDVVYVPRTRGVSTSDLKFALRAVDLAHVENLKRALDTVAEIVNRLE